VFEVINPIVMINQFFRIQARTEQLRARYYIYLTILPLLFLDLSLLENNILTRQSNASRIWCSNLPISSTPIVSLMRDQSSFPKPG
jgi:hypothetical protein